MNLNEIFAEQIRQDPYINVIWIEYDSKGRRTFKSDSHEARGFDSRFVGLRFLGYNSDNPAFPEFVPGLSM